MQTKLFRWLKSNLGPSRLGVLTSNDTHALIAATALCPMISWEGAPPELFRAFGAIVSNMQPGARHLAFHAVAFQLDWSHRAMIWQMAELGPIPNSFCLHEPLPAKLPLNP